jgi:hypothetical protein
LLELAAVEREAEEKPPQEVMIDRRNCEKEVGLSPRSFMDAAGRHFPAFKVGRRPTASKADVLAWLRSRVKTTRARPLEVTPTEFDMDAFLKKVDARFAVRVGRRMTDEELDLADILVDVDRSFASETGQPWTTTPDQMADQVQEKAASEPRRYSDWRSVGLDPAAMERDAEELRAKLYAQHPDWDWRKRQNAVYEMWSKRTEPLYEARDKARAEKRAANKAERAKRGELGLRK